MNTPDMTHDVKELLLLAIIELKNGNPDEALLILERTLYPKLISMGHAAVLTASRVLGKAA